MKVIKRDGRAVEYNSDKIRVAISKANEEVPQSEKATTRQIDNIIKYIETLDKKRILVEDIQDIIETKLMEQKRFVLAKKYVIYRYTRALVRKSNTTDETVLSLIKNNSTNISKNKNEISSKKTLVTDEVSIDLAKRVLLPKNIVELIESGGIYFHDLSDFAYPMFASSIPNLENYFNTIKPDSFIEAVEELCNIMLKTNKEQCQSISIDISILGKYLRKSCEKYEKKLSENMNINKENINELLLIKLHEDVLNSVNLIKITIDNLKEKAVVLLLNLTEEQKYNSIIIENILNNIDNCKLIYVLNEDTLNNKEYKYLTDLAYQKTKTQKLGFLSNKKFLEEYKTVYSPTINGALFPIYKEQRELFKGRFTQSLVTLNLPQIALQSSNEDLFFKNLEERLEICKDALMCKYYSLLGTISNVSKMNYQEGLISNLFEGEKIDKYLKNGYSNLYLGYIGLNEVVKVIKNKDITSEEGMSLALKIVKYMNNKCNEWSKELKVGFVLYGTDNEKVNEILREKDEDQNETINIEKYNGSFIPNKKFENIYKYLEYIKNFTSFTKGGSNISINLKDYNVDKEEFINYLYDNIKYIDLYEGEEK